VNQQDLLLQGARQVKACLLCGSRRLAGVACFIPNQPALWPGPLILPTTARFFWYGLCKRCARRKDRKEAVEARIQESSPRGTLH
jgi:hypothetical protein